MVVNTERYEEYCEKRRDLDARIKVNREVGHFAIANAERCKNERNFVEANAWLEVVEGATAKLKEFSAAYDELIAEFKNL